MASTDSTLPAVPRDPTRRSAVAERFMHFELHPAIALAGALAIEAAMVALDIAFGDQETLAATYMLGPFFVAFFSRPWVTAIAAAVAVVLAAASAAWNADSTSADYFLRLVAVAIGGGFAVFAAWWKTQMGGSLGRLSVLESVADIADGTLPLDRAVERFCRRLVPEVADLCILDAVIDGEIRRLGVAAAGPRANWIEQTVRSRKPPDPSAPSGSARAISRSEAQLLIRLDEKVLRGLAHDDEDYRNLQELNPRSAAVVPLEASGRSLGALTLVTADSGRLLDQDDFFFIKAIAGRAALSLDNAGLFRELSSVEQQLDAVLRNLADAVTVQRADGKLVYANQAAAEMLGARSAEALVAAPPAEVVSRFESYTEDGQPLDVENLPGRKVMRGEAAEPLLIRVLDRESGEEHWRMVKASPVEGPAGELRLVVNVVEDVTEVKRAEHHQRLLSESSQALLASLDYESTLQRVAEMAVPEFADWCSVNLPRSDGVLEQVAVAHVDPDKIEFARRLNRRFPSRIGDPGMGQVVMTGVSQLTDIPEEMLRRSAHNDEHFEIINGLGLRSAVVVPIPGPERPFGVISFVTAESRRVFAQADLRLAEELGRRAGVAIENSRLYSQRSAAAHALEEALVPGELPDVPGWRLASLYRPASEGSEVGGDFYDAFQIPGGWMVVIGDVCGRGVDAASVTALARYTLRTAGALSGDMITALTQLNRWLLERGDSSSICTVVTMTLTETGEVQIASAGHPPPLLLRGEEVVALEEHGPILGMTEDGHWPLQSIKLEPGDQLLLYTDGVTEFEGTDGRFGELRLRASISGSRSPQEAVERVRAAHQAFSPEPWDDDIAILALMHETVAVSAPEPAIGSSASG
ncbi:MAG: SpoIIE family protein phosphatase [Actinomycetota bacterium]|nr:SpoIIE family protein phosphatase [Actinomycetota bacterium]